METVHTPILLYRADSCQPSAIVIAELPKRGSQKHSVYLPLQVELLSRNCCLRVQKVYFIGQRFIVFSTLSELSLGKRGYTIARSSMRIPHFTAFDPQQGYHCVHFVQCLEETPPLQTPDKRFTTFQVSSREEFKMHLLKGLRDPEYFDAPEPLPQEDKQPLQEDMKDLQIAADELPLWRRWVPWKGRT